MRWIVVPMLWSGVAHGADWWVDPIGNGDGTSPSSPFDTIDAAIGIADRGDVIHLSAGIHAPPTSTITTHRLIIMGAGMDLTTVTTPSAGAAFTVHARGVAIADLTIDGHGQADDTGIVSRDGDLWVRSCAFRGTYDGIDLEGAHNHVQDSVFDGYEGIAVYIKASSEPRPTRVVRSTFSHAASLVDRAVGVGVSSATGAPEVLLTDNEFIGDRDEDGTGIYVWQGRAGILRNHFVELDAAITGHIVGLRYIRLGIAANLFERCNSAIGAGNDNGNYVIAHNTIVGEDASVLGDSGIRCLDDANLTVLNNLMMTLSTAINPLLDCTANARAEGNVIADDVRSPSSVFYPLSSTNHVGVSVQLDSMFAPTSPLPDGRTIAHPWLDLDFYRLPRPSDGVVGAIQP